MNGGEGEVEVEVETQQEGALSALECLLTT